MILPRLHLHQSYHALSSGDQRLWRVLRLFMPRRKRFLFEGCMAVPGQLWVADRTLLYDTIRREKPRIHFEVGTWLGGGSTLFAAQALYENGGGVVHTIELDPAMHAAAVAGYQRHLPHLLPHVRFHLGSSLDVYPAVLRELGRVDSAFLDGVGAEEALAEFQLLEPYMGPGALLMAHDWYDIKMSMVRPRLESASDWIVEEVVGPPASVGVARVRRRGRSGGPE